MVLTSSACGIPSKTFIGPMVAPVMLHEISDVPPLRDLLYILPLLPWGIPIVKHPCDPGYPHHVTCDIQCATPT